MSNSADETMLPPETKRGRHNERENEENKDRLSDLPDCVLLHILSFLKAKYAVRTCILSTRWKHLWKRIPTLILRYPDFLNLKSFNKFVSMILSRRDGSVALHGLDFDSVGSIQPHLLERVVNYATSRNVQRLRIFGQCDIQHISPCIFSCQTLTSLELSAHPRDYGSTLFPKSLNLPALTSLNLANFAFCAGDNGCAEPFSAFNRLNSLIIHSCKVKGAQILCISSTTLLNLTVRDYSFKPYNIELSAPSLCTFAFTGFPYQKLCGSNASSVKQVNIDTEIVLHQAEPPLVLLSWLQGLANIKSLTVSSSTLQILSLVPDLLKVKLPSLCNLKSLKIKLKPLSYESLKTLRAAELQKAAAKSRKEAAKSRKAFEAGLIPSLPIPDGIVDFLLQNSLSAEVDIIDCS